MVVVVQLYIKRGFGWYAEVVVRVTKRVHMHELMEGGSLHVPWQLKSSRCPKRPWYAAIWFEFLVGSYWA